MLLCHIPETPVCDLHLAVSPIALVFSDQIFQIFFFVAPYDICMIQRHQLGNAFIRKRTAQAVVTSKDKLDNSTVFCVIEHRVQRWKVTMDV